MKIKTYIDGGNSFPVICEKNGKEYFVKLRAGMSGKFSMINEWIGNRLGRQLKLNTQVPIWIELNNEVEIAADIHLEVKELIQKSFGLNIGFTYQAQAKEIKDNLLQSLNKKEAVDIFLFDLLMLNIDRSGSNTNLIKVGSEFFTIDYESSLLFQDIVESKNLIASNAILTCFKSSPLYQNIKEDSIDRFITKAKNLSIETAIKDIPLNILGGDHRSLLIEVFEERKSNNWFLKDTMEKLKTIKIESKEEQKKRMNRNQEIFKRNLKNNNTPK